MAITRVINLGGKQLQTARVAPVAPTVRSVNQYVASPTNGGSVPVTFTMPSGIQAGDLIEVFIAGNTKEGSAYWNPTTPAGWNLHIGYSATIHSYYGAHVGYWRTATGVESGTTFGITTATYTLHVWVAQVIVHKADPLTLNALGNALPYSSTQIQGVSMGTAASGTNTNLLQLNTGYYGAPELLLCTTLSTTQIGTGTAIHLMNGASHVKNNDTSNLAADAGTFLGLVSQTDGHTAAGVTNTASIFTTAYARDSSRQLQIGNSYTFNNGTASPNSHSMTLFWHAPMRSRDTRFLLDSRSWGKSSWQQVIGSANFASTHLILDLSPPPSASTTGNYSLFVDIGVGASGSEVPVYTDLALTESTLTSYQSLQGHRLVLPLQVQSGQRVAIRAYSDTTAPAATVQYYFNAMLVG